MQLTGYWFFFSESTRMKNRSKKKIECSFGWNQFKEGYSTVTFSCLFQSNKVAAISLSVYANSLAQPSERREIKTKLEKEL